MRRGGRARGIYNHLKEADRPSRKQILADVQWRLHTLIPGGGFPTCQMVFGPNPVDLYGREDKDENLTLAPDTSISGQFAQQ